MSDVHPEASQMDPSPTGEELEQRLGQLDQQIAQTVRNLVHELQQKLGESIRQSSGEILRQVEDDLVRRLETVEPELPASYVPSDEVTSLVRAAVDKAAQQARTATPDLEPLLAAVGRVDGETTQADILRALVREARGFASRAAFLLVRVGEVRGFAGDGWNGSASAIEGLRFEVPDEGAWDDVVRGTNAVLLDAGACRSLAGALGQEAGTEGILVPFVVRGQVAGVLYADRTPEDGETPGFASLQILTYAATQALETAAISPGTSPALLTAPEAPEKPLWQPSVVPEPAAVEETPAPEEPALAEQPAEEAPAAVEPSSESAGAAAFEPAEPPPLEAPSLEAPSLEAPSPGSTLPGSTLPGSTVCGSFPGASGVARRSAGRGCTGRGGGRGSRGRQHLRDRHHPRGRYGRRRADSAGGRPRAARRARGGYLGGGRRGAHRRRRSGPGTSTPGSADGGASGRGPADGGTPHAATTGRGSAGGRPPDG